jgi:pyridoxamine 5'-phosphate oxidase
MELKDYIEFANKNPACFIATTDGDQPRVRDFCYGMRMKADSIFIPGLPRMYASN